jgi:Leucine-rich repeat (LRR) protein
MMSGAIPHRIGKLGNLHYLSLYGNLLIGSIPTNLGNLSTLATFDVVSNKLTGSLPESLGNLSNLEKLGVGQNYFTGVVTHQNFAKLLNLKSLWLSSPFLTFDFNPHWKT